MKKTDRLSLFILLVAVPVSMQTWSGCSSQSAQQDPAAGEEISANPDPALEDAPTAGTDLIPGLDPAPSDQGAPVSEKPRKKARKGGVKKSKSTQASPSESPGLSAATTTPPSEPPSNSGGTPAPAPDAAAEAATAAAAETQRQAEAAQQARLAAQAQANAAAEATRDPASAGSDQSAEEDAGILGTVMANKTMIALAIFAIAALAGGGMWFKQRQANLG